MRNLEVVNICTVQEHRSHDVASIISDKYVSNAHSLESGLYFESFTSICSSETVFFCGKIYYGVTDAILKQSMISGTSRYNLCLIIYAILW